MRRRASLVASVCIVTIALLVALGPSALGQEQDQQQQETIDCDPFVNGIASGLFPGWGQWLNDDHSKAVTHVVLNIGLGAGAVLLYPTTASTLLGLGRVAWGFYSMFDAFRSCVNKHENIEIFGQLQTD